MQTVDVWAQIMTERMAREPWLETLLRWTGNDGGIAPPSVQSTLEAMDAAEVDLALIAGWHGPQGSLISNDEVAAAVAEAPDRLRGVSCGVEGDGALERRLARLVRALGARPFSLRGADRARYHAAAVLASDYVVALRAAAEDAWSLAGLPRAQAGRALQPLTEGAVAALGALPLERALTGPIARGDVQTVARHLQALAPAPELLDQACPEPDIARARRRLEACEHFVSAPTWAMTEHGVVLRDRTACALGTPSSHGADRGNGASRRPT